MSRTLFRNAFGVLLFGLACAGDPEDPFFLYGRAQDGSGRPLARALVTLSRGEVELCSNRFFHERPGAVTVVRRPGGVVQAVFPVFEPFRETETDDEGRFLFQLLRYELTTPGSNDGFNSTFCYRIDVEGGEGGAKTSVWTVMDYRDIYLERVYRWDEGLISLEPSVDGHLLSAPSGPLPPSDSVQLFVKDIVAYEWEVTAFGKPLWRAEQTASPFLVDGPIREDFAEVEARAIMLSILAPQQRPIPEIEELVGSKGVYSEHAAGPAVLLPSIDADLPVSRGAPCLIGATRLDPCPATDGKLDLEWFELPSSKMLEDVPRNALHLELTAPARPSLAIIRDVATSDIPITLEGSADGVTWSTLASLEFLLPGTVQIDRLGPYEWHTITMHAGRFLRVELTPPAQPITRIRAPGVFALRELSIFE
jgi:hypothetical protein